MIRLSITVDNIGLVLQTYDRIMVYRADSEEGTYVELTDVNTRIAIEQEKTIYFYNDDTGNNTHWYKTSYYLEPTGPESAQSAARQGGTEEEKIGIRPCFAQAPGELSDRLPETVLSRPPSKSRTSRL